MKTLIGKTIKELWVNGDQSKLVFVTDQGFVGYVVEGDCCSQSWFADITGVNCLLNSIIKSVEEVPMHTLWNDTRSRQDVDDIYCYKFTTDNGYAEVIFRNSSNGYYGGWCENYPVKNISGMTQILMDWSA